MIECNNLEGEKVLKTKEEMCFRVSAYGFIFNEGKLLVSRMRSTGKYFVPGGGINIIRQPIGINETLREGLTREIKEETGLEVEIGEHFFFTETFFNYNPKDKPELEEVNYCHCHFFLCSPQILDFCVDSEIEDDEATYPEWVNINELSQKNCQPLFWQALEVYKEKFL